MKGGKKLFATDQGNNKQTTTTTTTKTLNFELE